MTFGAASAVVARGDGVYEAAFDAAWLQGPGVFGGLSGAAILRAMLAEAGERPPRSVSLQYCAPVAPGPARIVVTRERAGTGSTFLSARLLQQERVQVHAIGAFGLDRPADLDEDHVHPPKVPPPSAAPELADGPGIPTFIAQFEVRPAYGAPPYSGARESKVGAWVRLRAPERVDPPLALALLDVLPPAILPRETRPRPVSTVSLHAHLLERLPRSDVDPEAPWWVDVHSRVTRAGWSDEEVRLFAPDGRLAGVARQLFAVIR